MTSADIRAKPLADFAALAKQINDSDPLMAIYATPEWNELHEEGQQWVSGLVRETIATIGSEWELPRLTADKIVAVNAFLTLMAERFREQTSRRLLGVRRYSLTREQAMVQALATFEAMDEPFGHPDQAWDRAHAHEVVDIELSYWER